MHSSDETVNDTKGISYLHYGKCNFSSRVFINSYASWVNYIDMS